MSTKAALKLSIYIAVLFTFEAIAQQPNPNPAGSEAIKTNWIEIGAAFLLGGVIAPLLVSWIQKKFKFGSDQAVSGAAERPIDSRNSVLILGRGGSGKTSFIKALTRNEIPSGETNNLKLYETTIFPNKEIPGYRFIFGDYRGQRLQDLLQAFRVEKILGKPYGKKYINTLVVIVDIFQGEDQTIRDLTTEDLDKQCEEYTSDWVRQTIASLLDRNEIRRSWVLVNKADLVKGLNITGRKKLTNTVKGLKESLEKATGREVEIVVGSATIASTVSAIWFSLFDDSVPE